eukprot:CAMPEP_0119363314 /NCGR_PEP_ID=MMETSP1334-20130426/10223_1 /TAXON_ID=127549 /ORGANISM="Calcidiscus leptoporus, Strain RCC1130" /LENGTH=72 /DNA_ID=CAMNT_0007378731 /DNA_START=914 /DNA_END=1132 /DNA_ORIENTATION=-
MRPNGLGRVGEVDRVVGDAHIEELAVDLRLERANHLCDTGNRMLLNGRIGDEYGATLDEGGEHSPHGALARA